MAENQFKIRPECFMSGNHAMQNIDFFENRHVRRKIDMKMFLHVSSNHALHEKWQQILRCQHFPFS